MSRKSNSFLNNLKFKLLSRLVGYYDGEYHHFANAKAIRLVKSNKKRLLTIVSKTQFTEKSKDYPAISTNELNKILAVENESSIGSYFKIHREVADNVKVNIWNFHLPNDFKSIPLPETLLLSKTGLSTSIVQVQRQHLFWVAQLDGAVYSSNKTPIISKPELFAQSVGRRYEKELLVSIEPNDYASTLLNNVLKLGFNDIKNFVKFSKESLRSAGASAIASSIAALSLYLLASSAFVYFQHNAVVKKFAEIEPQVAKSLSEQIAVDNHQLKYIEYKPVVLEQSSVSLMWAVIADLKDSVEINNLRQVNGKIEVRGTAEKATDVLALVASHKYVQNAKFERPTRKSKNKEMFVISFQIDNNTVENSSRAS